MLRLRPGCRGFAGSESIRLRVIIASIVSIESLPRASTVKFCCVLGVADTGDVEQACLPAEVSDRDVLPRCDVPAAAFLGQCL